MFPLLTHLSFLYNKEHFEVNKMSGSLSQSITTIVIKHPLVPKNFWIHFKGFSKKTKNLQYILVTKLINFIYFLIVF